MELFYYLLFCFLILILLLSIIVRRLKPKSEDPKLPPGPWQLPIIGSLHHLRSSLPPHHAFRELSKIYGPLMHLKFGSIPYVIVSSPEAAKAIIKTHEPNFLNRTLFAAVKIMTYNGKGILFARYGEEYRQVKKICILEMLSQKRVRSSISIREEEVHELVKSISFYSDGSGAVNLSKMLLLTTNNITGRVVFGNKCKQQTAYLEVVSELVKLAGGFHVADIFPSVSWLVELVSGSGKKIRRRQQKRAQILEEIFQEHREKRRGTDVHGDDEDFVDAILRRQEDGDLPFELAAEWVKAIIGDISGAGSETTSTTIVWVMTELIRNPRVMMKVQKEVREALKGKTKLEEVDIKNLNYMQLVIKETLRLHPPGPFLVPRECQNTCDVLGYEIPKKTRVLVNLWTIGRDPQYWNDAEDFMPERFEENPIDFKGTSFEFLPFSAGRRMCPGMWFALSNVELILSHLLYHFDWALPKGIEPSDVDMNETFGATSHKRDDLCLHAISAYASRNVL